MRYFCALLMALGSSAQSIPFPGPVNTVSSPACTPVTGYLHCRVLTIDHTQVGTADSSNFPVLVSATLGSSRIQNASCFDVVFTSDSGGATKIPWEQETCTQSTGVVLDWVLVGTLSHTADTVFYVSYDNSSISTAQNTGALAPTNVWDSNYNPVYHFPDGSTLSETDSTSNANTLIATGGGGTDASATTGRIDGGSAWDGTANIRQFTSFPSFAGQFTISLWVNSADNASTRMFVGGTGSNKFGFNGGPFFIRVLNGGNSDQTITPPATGSFYLFTLTRDASDKIDLYINGGSATRLFADAAQSGTSAWQFIGGATTGSQLFSGSLDEVRFSSTLRSASWILAGYNNQKTGSTFLTVGGEV